MRFHIQSDDKLSLIRNTDGLLSNYILLYKYYTRLNVEYQKVNEVTLVIALLIMSHKDTMQILLGIISRNGKY